MSLSGEHIINLKWSSYELSENCNPLRSDFAHLVIQRQKYSFSIICELGEKKYCYKTAGIFFWLEKKEEWEDSYYRKNSYRKNIPVLNKFCEAWNCSYELFEEVIPGQKTSDGREYNYRVYAKMFVCDGISAINNEKLRIKNNRLNAQENLVKKIQLSTFDKFDKSLVKNVAESFLKFLGASNRSDYSIIVTEGDFRYSYSAEYGGEFSFRITPELEYEDVDAFFVSVMNRFSDLVAQSETFESFYWYPADEKKKLWGLDYNIFKIELTRK